MNAPVATPTEQVPEAARGHGSAVSAPAQPPGSSRRLLRARRWRLGPFEQRWYPRATLVGTLLLVLLGLLSAWLVTTGSYPITLPELWQVLTRPDDGPATTIVWEMRLPRVATGLATGAALGVSGLLFQSLSRNALGSPEIIGLVSGAALGAVVGITLLGSLGWTTSLAAVVGCGAAAVVGHLLTPRGPSAVQRFVLVGIGLSALWSALTSLLLTRIDPDTAIAGQVWLTGTLTARTWEHAVVPAVALLVVLPVALARAPGLAVLDTGTDMSGQLGLSHRGLTGFVTVAGVALTGAAIASAGPISFVSLAAPQVARQLAGRDAVPVTTSALTGAVLLVGAEALVQALPEQWRGPVGIATSVLGGLYLIAFILRRNP